MDGPIKAHPYEKLFWIVIVIVLLGLIALMYACSLSGTP